MVVGIDKFREHFAGHENEYVLIGGAACDLVFDEKLLIPFKAKAFLDLTKRQTDGVPIDNDDIKKHRNDVYRLAQLLTAETSVALPDAIRADLNAYLAAVEGDASFDPNTFGVRTSKQDGATLLRTVYKL